MTLTLYVLAPVAMLVVMVKEPAVPDDPVSKYTKLKLRVYEFRYQTFQNICLFTMLPSQCSTNVARWI